MTIHAGPIMGLLLCLAATPVQAKTHLDRSELKILADSSVAVVYVDADSPVERSLDPEHHLLGVTPLTAVVADVVNSYRLHMLLVHIGPYQSALEGLALPDRTHRGLQDALGTVPWLEKTPWADVRQDPRDALFLTQQAERAKAPVVIFISPRLFLDSSADTLYMVCAIDIETTGPDGSEVRHYDSSEMIAAQPVDDADLPPATVTQGPLADPAAKRMARLFADGGAAFNKVYAKLLARSQQQLYYYFTGTRFPPQGSTIGR
ncbi:MAG TPA: hypothetical protein VLV87_09865 [Gammaproteobacteria bacterium]|nr:hypothetical protein [Gammaproteobacteria bacterium]